MSKTFPFPTLWSAQDDSSTLVKLLPPEQEIFAYLNAFQRRAQSCSFPHVPEECTEREIRRFLSNVEHNAAVHLDMLALVFCTLAQGIQNGVYDKYGERWVAGAVETESKKGNVWSKEIHHPSIVPSSLMCRSRCCNAVFKALVVHEPANPIDCPSAGHDQSLFNEQWQVPRRMGFVWHDHPVGAEYRL